MTNNVYFKLETIFFRSSLAVRLRQTTIYGYMLSERLQLFAKFILLFVLRNHLS